MTMGKKDKITITRPDDFSSVEEELSAALDDLEQVNTRVEAFLKEQVQREKDFQPPVEPMAVPAASDAVLDVKTEG